MHVCHDRSEDVDLSLIEVESVTIGRVSTDHHDHRFAIDDLLRPSDFEGLPVAGTRRDADRDELADRLVANGSERGNREIQVVRVDDIEHVAPDEFTWPPFQRGGNRGVGKPDDARTVNGDHRIPDEVDRWSRRVARRGRHAEVSARCIADLRDFSRILFGFGYRLHGGNRLRSSRAMLGARRQSSSQHSLK